MHAFWITYMTTHQTFRGQPKKMYWKFIYWQVCDVHLSHTNHPQWVIKHIFFSCFWQREVHKKQFTARQGSLGSSHPEVSAPRQAILRPFSKLLHQLYSRELFHKALLRGGLRFTHRFLYVFGKREGKAEA